MARKKTLTKDKLEENVFQKEYLMPSDVLNLREVEIWNSVVKSMKPSYFIETDRVLLIEYIKLKQISDLAYQQLHDYDNLTSPEASKLINIITKTTGALSTTSQKLGIAPSSRVRHESKTNKLDDVVSELDSLLD